jgi:hypothetical protein
MKPLKHLRNIWLCLLLSISVIVPSFADDHENEDLEFEQEIETLWSEIKEALELSKSDLEVVTNLMEKLKEENPDELYEHLEHYRDILEHEGPERLNMEMTANVQEFRVEILVDRYHEMDDPTKKENLKIKLREQLATLMEVRLQMRLREYEQLSQELIRIKKGIDAVKKNPDQFIDKKMSELLEYHFDPFD